MDVIHGDPGPEQRGKEAAPPVDLEDIVQAGRSAVHPGVVVRHEHVREAQLRIRRRGAHVHRHEVVDGAHDARGGIHALDMRDVRAPFARSRGRGREEPRGGEEQDVHEARGGLPQEDEELRGRGAEAGQVHRERGEQVPDADAEEQAARVGGRDVAAGHVVRVWLGDQHVGEVVERDDGRAGYGLVEEDE